MSKRFTATDIWDEDWFLEMPTEYKLFWYYLLSACNHAGLFRVNTKKFCGLNGVKVTSSKALEYFNADKQRIRKISESIWLIEDFFFFQYGSTFNPRNKVHASIEKAYNQLGIEMTSIRGLKDLKEGVKDKDILYKKDSSIGNDETSSEEGGVGETEPLTDEKLIAPKMVGIFKTAFPHYPIDLNADFTASLQIAHKIAKSHGWKKSSVTNGQMEPCLSEWQGIVDFVKTDPWYNTKSISFLNDKFQNLIQAKNSSHATNQSVSGKTFTPDKF